MEKLPKNIREQTELTSRREHPHEDLSKISGDFEAVGKKFTEIFAVAREKTVAETLGSTDSTFESIKSLGLENFPGLNDSVLQLHKQADNILSQ